MRWGSGSSVMIFVSVPHLAPGRVVEDMNTQERHTFRLPPGASVTLTKRRV